LSDRQFVLQVAGSVGAGSSLITFNSVCRRWTDQCFHWENPGHSETSKPGQFRAGVHTVLDTS